MKVWFEVYVIVEMNYVRYHYYVPMHVPIFNATNKQVIELLFVYCIIRISKSVHNNAEAPIGDDMQQGQGSSDQAPHNVPTNPSGWLQATPVMLENPNNYKLLVDLVSELIKRISLVLTKKPLKEDKTIEGQLVTTLKPMIGSTTQWS